MILELLKIPHLLELVGWAFLQDCSSPGTYQLWTQILIGGISILQFELCYTVEPRFSIDVLSSSLEVSRCVWCMVFFIDAPTRQLKLFVSQVERGGDVLELHSS